MPVEIIVGFFVFNIAFINCEFPISKDATLKSLTFRLFKNSTDSISNGVEKKVILFSLQ